MQYDSYNVIGTIPYLGLSVARLGWSAGIKVIAIDANTTAIATCECYEESVCVTFQYIIIIDPPLQATRPHSRLITVCGDGSYNNTVYN